MKIPLTLCVLVAIGSVPRALSGEQGRPRPGVRLFYRMLGSRSNAPYVRKTRSVASADGAIRTASTGMANAGFTEYPFCEDRWTFTFEEQYGMLPRFACSVPIDPRRVNVSDIVVDWVYEPDGCVWGPSCREYAQTFVARGRELVAATLLVASPRGRFHLALQEEGPGGPEAAPRKTFVSGHSLEWGSVRWKAGEAPLRPGQRYCLRIWREDGDPWTPYFHSSGNVYDEGCAHYEGEPRPESDIAVWIMEEPEDVSRALIPGVDEEGWSRGVTGFQLVPRTPNVRMISAEFQPVDSFCVYLGCRVWKLEPARRLVAGPKFNVTCARPGRAYRGNFLFTPGELDCQPGDEYFAEVFTAPFHEGRAPEMPPDVECQPPRDLRGAAYGETLREARPVLSNVNASFPAPDTLRVTWRISRPAGVLVEVPGGGPGGDVLRHVTPAGQTVATIGGVLPGADVDFRLLAFPETCRLRSSYAWRSPLYRVRAPGEEPPRVLWPETPEAFTPLAPRPRLAPLRPEPPASAPRIAIPGGDFEAGLGGWEESQPGIGSVSAGTAGIRPWKGERMYGWTHRAGKERRDVLLENSIRQSVAVRPGHRYELAAWAVTDVGEGPRGDTRVRFAVDPEGEGRRQALHTTQWYWTDGDWMRLSHRFTARADCVTIFIDLFRWRDLDRASAYVDDVTLHDLGPQDSPRR